MPDGEVQILACGSRTYEDYDYIRRRLEEVALTYFYGENVGLVHGGSRGADNLSGIAGRSLGFDIFVEHAEWELYGRSAGPIRNARMLDVYQPHIVVAFPKGPLTASRGTLDMVSRSAEKGVMVIVF